MTSLVMVYVTIEQFNKYIKGEDFFGMSVKYRDDMTTLMVPESRIKDATVRTDYVTFDVHGHGGAVKVNGSVVTGRSEK